MKIGATTFISLLLGTFLSSNASALVQLDNQTSTMIEQCSNGIPKDIMIAITGIESKFNPYAIGVVNGYVKQPNNINEAVETVKRLHAEGKNFSMGIAQVNKYNLNAYGLNYETVFDPCRNLNAGSKILLDCFKRAEKVSSSINQAWEKSFSCYYSGNFKTGFRQDFPRQPPYVTKIVNTLKRVQSGNDNYIVNSANDKNNYLVSDKNSLANNLAIMQNTNEARSSNEKVNSSYEVEAIKIAQVQNEIKNKTEHGRKWETFSEFSSVSLQVF